MVQVFVPIFPLPDLTFFPHTALPLHVFEARYRSMVTDCLSRDKRLAVVGLVPGHEAAYDGKPPVHAVAGLGQIVRWERLASGRYNMLLKGERRIRILRELPSDTLYRVVAAEALEETGAEAPGVRALVARVTARCLGILETVRRPTDEMRNALEGVAPGALCDRIASAVIPDAGLRQRLLEELDVERRLQLLAEALDDLGSRLAGGRG